MNASIPVGSNKKHQGNPYPSVCFALLRVVVTVRDTATRDVDVTVSIDNQPRTFMHLPGCSFMNALIIP